MSSVCATLSVCWSAMNSKSGMERGRARVLYNCKV